MERLDRETIEAIQLRALNRVLAREKARGGFYRDLPESLGSLAELSSLPFTREEDLARSPGALLMCSQSKIQRVLSDATSGTTGEAKRVFYTEGDLENTVRLYEAGLGELIGAGDGVMICFPFSGPFGLGELIAEALRRLGARPLRAGASLSWGGYAELLESEKPAVFVGMPVQLLGILRLCGRGSLRRALVSGDSCPDSVISGCEAILGSRLFPHYGSREMGMAGAICCSAHEGMHLRENHVIAEIVDPSGRPLGPGERGELVITTVGMEAMPLIRYRTGDLTRILPGECPCGSAVIRLGGVERGGTGVSAAELDGIMFSDDQLVDCRYELCGEELSITALCRGNIARESLILRIRELAPALRVTISARRALPGDGAMYAGKRIIISG